MGKRLGKTEKTIFTEKFMEFANLSAVALIVSQLLSASIDWGAFAFGILILSSAYIFAYNLMRGGAN